MARTIYEFTTKAGTRVRHEGTIDERTTRHPGYKVSQVVRKVIETLFGDAKQHGATIRQVKLRGTDKVGDVLTIAMLAVNMRRLPKLFAAQGAMVGGMNKTGASKVANWPRNRTNHTKKMPHSKANSSCQRTRLQIQLPDSSWSFKMPQISTNC